MKCNFFFKVGPFGKYTSSCSCNVYFYYYFFFMLLDFLLCKRRNTVSKSNLMLCTNFDLNSMKKNIYWNPDSMVFNRKIFQDTDDIKKYIYAASYEYPTERFREALWKVSWELGKIVCILKGPILLKLFLKKCTLLFTKTGYILLRPCTQWKLQSLWKFQRNFHSYKTNKWCQNWSFYSLSQNSQ